MVTEHHGIKEEAQQTHSVEVREVIYYKSVLGNHHTQHAKIQTQTQFTAAGSLYHCIGHC